MPAGRSPSSQPTASRRSRPAGILQRLSDRPGVGRLHIGGIAVNIAARVAAIAGPNETLVSSTVHDLVAGSGLQFEERVTRPERAESEASTVGCATSC
jgi:hypothetical protein